jgi:phosphatidylglycerophosphate synthase
MRLKVEANAITGGGFLLGYAGCLMIAFGNYALAVFGAVLVNVWALLDYADGQVARLNNTKGNFGRFLDNLADTGVAALLFICLGISVGSTVSMFLGGWISVCYLYMLIVAYNYERLISPKLQDDVVALRARGLPRGVMQLAHYNLCNVTGVVMPLVLVSAVCGFLGVILWVWAVIITLAVVAFTTLMIRKAGDNG